MLRFFHQFPSASLSFLHAVARVPEYGILESCDSGVVQVPVIRRSSR